MVKKQILCQGASSKALEEKMKWVLGTSVILSTTLPYRDQLAVVFVIADGVNSHVSFFPLSLFDLSVIP
jgi:hypothetical protein